MIMTTLFKTTLIMNSIFISKASYSTKNNVKNTDSLINQTNSLANSSNLTDEVCKITENVSNLSNNNSPTPSVYFKNSTT